MLKAQELPHRWQVATFRALFLVPCTTQWCRCCRAWLQGSTAWSPHLLRSSTLSLRAGSPADSSLCRAALASVHAGRPRPMKAFRVGCQVTQKGVADKRPHLP